MFLQHCQILQLGSEQDVLTFNSLVFHISAYGSNGPLVDHCTLLTYKLQVDVHITAVSHIRTLSSFGMHVPLKLNMLMKSVIYCWHSYLMVLEEGTICSSPAGFCCVLLPCNALCGSYLLIYFRRNSISVLQMVLSNL